MFIVSILLLAIVAIGAVSASEEISDDVAAIEPTDDVITESVEADEISQSDDVSQEADEAIIDSNVIADTEDDIKNDFDVEIKDNINDDEFVIVQPKTSRKGNLSVLINDEEKARRESGSAYQYIYFEGYEFRIMDTGNYLVKVNFMDEDSGLNVTLAQKNILFIAFDTIESNLAMSADEILHFTLKVPGVSSGTITAYEYIYGSIGKEFGSANIINNAATFEISGLTNSFGQLFFKYSTNLGDGNNSLYIRVLNNTDNVKVSVPTEITQGDNVAITVQSNESGRAYVVIDGTEKIYTDVSSLNYALSNLGVGTHSVRVVFANKNGFYSSNSPFYANFFKVIVKEKASPAPTVKPVVKKVATKIVAAKKTFKVKTKIKKYTITLKAGKKAVKKVKVTLKVKGKTYKATTNKKGKATFKIKNLKKKGKYTAVIKFAGNKNYKASSKKVKLTVKK